MLIPTNSKSDSVELTDLPFELDSLSRAIRYQKWLHLAVQPFLGNRILELGAGIGNLSQHLPKGERLILTDVDPGLLQRLRAKFEGEEGLEICQVDPAESLAARFSSENINTIVSFNVLEHVENDVSLVKDCLQLLRESKSPGKKRFIAVVPAHSWAFGTIDRELGHWRRYSRKSFRSLLAEAGVTDFSRTKYYAHYMNFPGVLGWFLNGRILGKTKVGTGSLKAFEALCPIIRPVDSFLQKTLRIPLGLSLVVAIEV